MNPVCNKRSGRPGKPISVFMMAGIGQETVYATLRRHYSILDQFLENTLKEKMFIKGDHVPSEII
jgi:hypothetical protein